MYAIDQATVTLISGSINLKILNQVWLLDNKVVTRAELDEAESFQSPVAVNIASSTFEFLALTDRVQLTLKQNHKDNGDLVKRIIGKFVEALPHTPYIAIGVNFRYIVTPSDSEGGLKQIKKFYLNDTNPLAEYFSSDDSRYGLYLSTNSLSNTRLRLDIKPSNNSGVDRQVLNFNFHSDLESDTKVDVISNLLFRWNEFFEEAEKITSQLHNGIDGA